MGFDWLKVSSNSGPKYLFKLDGETGIKVLENAPVEWPEVKLQFKRDSFYHGVITEAIVGQLTFIKDGKRYLEDIYTRSGVFGECSLRIYYLDEVTRTYKELPTSYKIDFNTYRLVKYKKSINGVQISLLPNDLPAKLYQRQDTEVDLTKAESLGGQTIDTTRDHWASIKDTFNFPEIKSYITARYDNSDTYLFDRTGGVPQYIFWPQTVTYADPDFADEAQNIIGSEFSAMLSAKALFYNSDSDRTVDVFGTLYLTVNHLDDLGSIEVLLAVVDTSNNIQSTQSIKSVWLGTGVYEIPVDLDVTLATGECIVIYILTSLTAFSRASLTMTGANIIIQDPVIDTVATTTEALPIYEAMERNLQLIFDKQYPMYSDFFGRTDVVYNNAGDMYPTENQERFASVMSGLCIRGLKLDQDNNPILTTFKKLFKDCDARWNIGGGFEMVGSEMVFRIEEKAHFYADSEALDLSARLWDIEIEQEVGISKCYAKVSTGYNKSDYFLINGRGEYNTINKRTTEIPNDTLYDNIAPSRSDTRGMTLLLAKPMATTGTEDARGDEDIFIVKSQRNGTEWDAETNENIQILNNSSLFQIGSLNLFFTPVRNMLRHNYILASGFYPESPGTDRTIGYLRFQSGSKLTTLQTTDGADDITENEDIVIGDLGNPRWYPEYLVAEVSFYEADYQAIKANPKGYVTLGDNYKGWIESLVWELSTNKAQLKLLRKWA